MRGPVVAALVIVLTIGACGDNLEVNATSPSPSPPSAEAGGPRCADRTLFVSASTGNDGNDGCSSDKPLKTISAAIGRAKTTGATDHQAKVCAGVYPEALILDHPLSLRGGYDCFNWRRADDFGYPNLPTNPETKIEASAGDVALLIKSPAITRATEVEGLTVVGPAGVSILGGAAPLIRNCLVRGTTTGVSVEEASPSLTDSKISAGSVAVDVKSSTLTAANQNALVGLDIASSQAAESHWAGIRVGEGSEVEIFQARIRGGAVTCPAEAQACSSTGVRGRPQSKIRVERSRIAAGEITNPIAASRTAAVFATQSTMTLINNMLHSGSVGYTPQPETQAVLLEGCPSPRVFNNTLFATGTGLRTAAIYLLGATTDAVVQNNILGSTLGHGVAVLFDECAGNITKIENNAGVNVRGAARSMCSTNLKIDQEIPSIGWFQLNEPTRQNNVALVETCAVDDADRCTKCNASATCVTELIAGWNPSQSDSGLTALFSPAGWKLLPTATCRIAKPATPLPTTSEDAFGAARTSPISMGAHEQEDCSAP